ncbi:UNVERIFIED_CONTAM: hypothetical protein Slati_1725000 [Sesamum latifolium]|uniref:Uncharacterized protein n=1 Tax=Sesamum latifolium TaxID=2727402 RepID=A0AAW2WXD2_9LAMI
MFSGMPPILCGRGRGQEPPLSAAPSHASQGGAVFRPPPPPTTPLLAASQTPDDATPSGAAPTPEEGGQ